MPLPNQFVSAIVKRFKTYKDLGDKTFEQLKEEDFFYKPSAESNSIAIIIQHMYGNAMSRFTNFLTEDGEKEWRNRDGEFKDMNCSKEDLLSFWNMGWHQVFTTIADLTEEDLEKTIYIRTEPLIAYDALLRQLAHYPYHVGQIVYIGKLLKDNEWQSLSIPKNESHEFNQLMAKR